MQFYSEHAYTKSKDSGNADFPVTFPCSRINCAGLSVRMEQFCGPCLLNILFQTSIFKYTVSNQYFFGNNYCDSRMLSGVWAV